MCNSTSAKHDAYNKQGDPTPLTKSTRHGPLCSVRCQAPVMSCQLSHEAAGAGQVPSGCPVSMCCSAWVGGVGGAEGGCPYRASALPQCVSVPRPQQKMTAGSGGMADMRVLEGGG